MIKIVSKRSRTVATGTSNGAILGEKNNRVKLTEKQIKSIKERLKNATTLDEINRLEKMLNEGRIPIDSDQMEE